MLNENHVTDLLANHFIECGFDIIGKLTTKQKGIDLIIQDKFGVRTYIEVKGGTSSDERTGRFGAPFYSKQINNHVGRAMLATFKAMKNFGFENSFYAMAFPDTPGHVSVLEGVKPALDKLQVKIYVVSNDGIYIL